MNLLGLLLMISLAIAYKTFPPTLALTANSFTVLFNDVPFAVTGNADHFNLLEESVYGAIERVSLPDLAYTPVLCDWQEKKTNQVILKKGHFTP
jgi:hypothetical protein